MSTEWETSTLGSAWKPHLLNRMRYVDKLPIDQSPHIARVAKITFASDSDFHALDLWYYNREKVTPTAAQQSPLFLTGSTPPFIERLVFPSAKARDGAYDVLTSLREKAGYVRIKII
jgi:hypothetical protein